MNEPLMTETIGVLAKLLLNEVMHKLDEAIEKGKMGDVMYRPLVNTESVLKILLTTKEGG